MARFVSASAQQARDPSLKPTDILAARAIAQAAIDVELFTIPLYMTSLYSIAFVAALRRVPLFPRLLVAIWMIDILMQIVIAKLTVSAGGIPHAVAMPLQGMLTGNIQKVLISVCLWLPYLLLSRRVNVTYRSRIAR